MKKKFQKIMATVLTAAMAMSVCSPAFANTTAEEEAMAFIKSELNDTTLSAEAEQFLKENQIYNLEERVRAQTYSLGEENLYVGILDEDVLALKRAAEAHNFTNEQIVQYVEGLVNTPSRFVPEDKNSAIAVASVPEANNRPAGDDGIGYEVQSKTGYSQATSYATLPKRSINNMQDIAYIFYTVYAGKYCMDFGLRAGMYSWAIAYNPIPSGFDTEQTIPKKDGERVYFNVYVEKNGVLRCRILDANNFSNVLFDDTYEMTGVAKDSCIFNKQITMCRADRNFTTGSKISNGKFTASTLYNSAGYYTMNTSNCNSARCGRFGVTGVSGSREKVTVNNYTQWDSEDITIEFRNS